MLLFRTGYRSPCLVEVAKFAQRHFCNISTENADIRLFGDPRGVGSRYNLFIVGTAVS
jgi:hypothetical protein